MGDLIAFCGDSHHAADSVRCRLLHQAVFSRCRNTLNFRGCSRRFAQPHDAEEDILRKDSKETASDRPSSDLRFDARTVKLD